MPRLSKWMADSMETLFTGQYHGTIITQLTYIDSNLKLVRFEGDFSTIKREVLPGNCIEIRISDTEFRHYCPMIFNSKQGICDILFYLHGMNIGSQWADNLQLGNYVKIIGPSRKMNYDLQANRHLVFGDETSLGLMQNIYRMSSSRNEDCVLIINSTNDLQAWKTYSRINPNQIFQSPYIFQTNRISDFDEWLFQVQKSNDKIACYLTGNAKEIKCFRSLLITRGINRKNIQTYTYWTSDKTG